MAETNRIQFLKKHKLPLDTQLSVSEIAKLIKFPPSALQQVYNRGIGAHRTNLESVRLKKDFSKNPDTSRFPASARLSPEQWAMARVYSFANKGTTYHTADSDIASRFS